MLVLSFVVAAVASCSSRPVIRQQHLTVSTRTGAAVPHEVLGPVATSYCDHLVLLVLPYVHDPGLVYGALFDQVQQLGGDAIIDFRIQMRDTAWFFPVYMKGCWHAEGTAIRYQR